MPRLPQSSESQPFPLPILPCPDIPVGGRLAHFVQHWGELTNNKWVLSVIQDGFRTPFRLTPPFGSSNKSESIFLSVTMRRDRGSSPEMGSGKGTRSGISQFLFPVISCHKNKWKVTAGNRSFYTKSIHKKTTFQDGDSQVSKAINISQQLGCLHRPDRCLFSCSNSSSIQEVSLVHLRKSGLPIHSLTFRNVP